MRRWTRIFAYGLLILIALAAIVTQIVLWTDYPRKLVLALVQQELGLRVEARSLATGWLGSTTLHDVRLSLPLADESFLDMPTMTVKHTMLLPLLVTQHLDLKSIELDKPNLVIRRDAEGRWNIQDVAQLVAKAGAGTPAPGTKKNPPKLPKLRLNDGTVIIVERDGRKSTIAQLKVTGDPEGALVYHYDAEVPKRLKIVGKVAPGDSWSHEFRMFAEPGDWLAPWMAEIPRPLVINAQWTGLVTGNSLGGRMVIEQAKYKNFGAQGRVAFQTGGGPIMINPQGLVVTTGDDAIPDIKFSTGSAIFEGTTLKLNQVLINAAGGNALLDGATDLAAQTGDIKATWKGLAGPGQMQHGGMLTASIKRPLSGGSDIAATLLTQGQLPKGSWDAEIKIAGVARNWSDIDWTVSSPHMGWQGNLKLGLKEITAHLTQRGQLISLQDLSCPSAEQLAARGEANLQEKTWYLRFNGRGRVPSDLGADQARGQNSEPSGDASAPGAQTASAVMPSDGGTSGSAILAAVPASGLTAAGAPVDFLFDASGTWVKSHLQQLLVHCTGTELRVTGDFVATDPDPLALSVYLDHLPESVVDAPSIAVKGRLISEFHLGGTVDPLHLVALGSLRTRNFVVRNRDFGDIRGSLHGIITPDRVEFLVKDLALLGGQCQVTGEWPYLGKDKLVAGDDLRIKVSADRLDLKEVGQLLGLDPSTAKGAKPAATSGPDDNAPLSGAANGHWVIDIPIPKARHQTMTVTGSLEATDIAARGFSADRLTAQVVMRDGTLHADPITLLKNDRDVTGKATFNVTASTNDLMNPTVQATVVTWPIRLALPDSGPTTNPAATGPASGSTTAPSLFATTAPVTAPATALAATSAASNPTTAPTTGPDATPSGGIAAISAESTLQLDLQRRTASGPLTARAQFATTRQAIGDANVVGQIQGTTVELETITANAAGGHAQGHATINLLAPNSATAALSWSDVDGARLGDLLADLEPDLKALTGSFAGALQVQPADSNRAVAPLRITASLNPTAAKLHALDFGPSKISAFVELTPSFGLDRIVLDELPSEHREEAARDDDAAQRGVPQKDRPLEWNDFRIADGRLKLWARRGRHPSGQVQTHIIADFWNLDLNQIIHGANPEAKELPGRLTGKLVIHGDPYERDLVLGQGHVVLSDSDLTNAKPLELLYNTFNLGTKPDRPIGRGSLDINLQRSTLSLRNVRYFNRGVEARSALVAIDQIWNLPDSPLHGYVVGSARPLKDLKLPVLADVDQVLNVLQASLTTVKIEGTLRKSEVKVVPFAEVGDALRRFLVGDVNSEVRGREVAE